MAFSDFSLLSMVYELLHELEPEGPEGVCQVSDGVIRPVIF